MTSSRKIWAAIFHPTSPSNQTHPRRRGRRDSHSWRACSAARVWPWKRERESFGLGLSVLGRALRRYPELGSSQRAPRHGAAGSAQSTAGRGCQAATSASCCPDGVASAMIWALTQRAPGRDLGGRSAWGSGHRTSSPMDGHGQPCPGNLSFSVLAVSP
uniref:Uncharacterized protein n=1 Tax=Arundo donax TaxID=35708 RepID=A0A0A9EHE9_ARUDO